MTVTKEQLESFHRFADEKLDNGGGEQLTWAQLLQLWRLEHSTDDECAEVRGGIQRGLAELDAGMGRPLDDFMDEFRRQQDISEDA